MKKKLCLFLFFFPSLSKTFQIHAPLIQIIFVVVVRRAAAAIRTTVV
jgi:hypothetical protein